MKMSATPFHTVLVANRGEIACRIIRTLRSLGIRSVAVYSDADRGARHVLEADLAVRIGPAAAVDSYLSAAAIVEAATRTSAQAIHPGYGFLSENAALATACADAGVVFIGPGARALDIMGDKIRSKLHVSARGVPVIPGTDEPAMDDDALAAAAEHTGYPLLIKPSAGGGGKGMQVVRTPSELPAGLAAARRIARAAFGDDTLLLERLIEQPRHIEVQVLADRHGTIVHLGERECSLQRRHQKVIEEAPSPLLDDRTRARIGEAACEVARSVDYVGAGTVEFLVSAERPDEFFFMEMNARLQVEHPVTELVTGIDLVEWQVRIAAGEPLTLRQQAIVHRGHAIEARVYAEDPEHAFLPGTGRVLALAEPVLPGIRIDSSLRVGGTITADYDPMLAKVIAWGHDRGEAIARLDTALRHTTLLGVQNNIEYLRLLLADPAVLAGDLDTLLIDRVLPSLAFGKPDAAAFAAAALLLHAERERRADTVWSTPGGWRLGAARPTRYLFRASGEGDVEVLVTGTTDAAAVVVAGGPLDASLVETAPNRYLVTVDGTATSLAMARDGQDLWIARDGTSWRLRILDRRDELAAALADRDRSVGPVSPEVRSPMPGTVVAVHAATGDRVTAGQPLVTVEAMKMEHTLLAPIDGCVTVTVADGDLVRLDAVVATVAPPEIPASTTEPAAGPQDPAAIHTRETA
ncbi:acetyl/propionyl/methylcrotonyl-CoA carboxylase subunit alpha [Marisediminicola antarctica]|uniref:biotin carboxylase n=2 Tax=Marisediminicola antarctica TaxID=674079 RepID=A0A7L5AIP9_9MICO|nr:acetyl/propionyl-CoA carboxylase subuit alpha [Marisediminicola antarctica]